MRTYTSTAFDRKRRSYELLGDIERAVNILLRDGPLTLEQYTLLDTCRDTIHRLQVLMRSDTSEPYPPAAM